MSNSWGNRSGFKNGKELFTLLLGLIIFIMILNHFCPGLFANISSILNPDSTVSADNINLPVTDYQDAAAALDSSQISTDIGNTLTSGVNNANNEISTGYWIIFSLDGSLQQFSVSAQDCTFIKDFIQKDNQTTPANVIYLVQNGQIQKYAVSNEMFSIISNLETIYSRNTNNSTNSSTGSTNNNSSVTTTPTTSISETINVDSVSTTGFVITLNPALKGLTANNFTLADSSGNKITITGVTALDEGASYMLSASLSANQTYSLTAAAAGYTFGTPQNIVVP